MATTNFTAGTLIESTWLNDVDEGIYVTLPAATSGLADHIADTTAAHAASAIANTPAGSIAATTVQAAIDELDAEKQPLDAQLTTLAGITAQQATDLASVSTFMGTTLNDADAATFRTTTGTEPVLIAESIVSGADVTNVQFTGLDINTHKSYRVEMEITSTAAGASPIYLFVNGDTVATNYYSQFILASNATITAAKGNTAEIAAVFASSVSTATIDISISSAGYTLAKAYVSRGVGSVIESITFTVSKVATVANITQLDFTASVANSIGIGSKIRIYRGDK